ncbi:MAG: tetratricopeptide repeat protein [Gammaproteobacteria bacterium]
MSFYEELKRRNVVRVAVLYGVASWLILQVADVLFPRLGAPEGAFGLVLGLLILGFFPALIISWVYEMTPEGLKREEDVDRSQSITPETGRKINFLIIALLVLAIAAIVIDRLVPETGSVARESVEETTNDSTVEGEDSAAPELSIAVLPFADMSPQKDQEYFTDGISEELLNLLARIPDFRVAGRTSSFAFKGKNEDLRTIGQKLDVGVILEGSVRKDGDQIRVTAQLVKADDGYHIWSDTYDRKLENIFALQDDIAGQVVAALKETLLEDEAATSIQDDLSRQRPTDSSEAYASYLRARHLFGLRSYDSMFGAVDAFQKAIALDPEFAQAYAGLAETYLTIGDYGYQSFDELEPLAKAAIDRALILDPDLSEGWTAKGLYLDLTETDKEDEVLELFERAVALNPSNSRALIELAWSYELANRRDDGERMMLRAYEVDPLSPVVVRALAIAYKAVGDDDRSEEFMAQLEILVPASGFLYRARAAIAEMDNNFVAATSWLQRAVDANERDLISRRGLARSLLEIGALDAAEKYAREAYELSPASPAAIVRVVDAMQYQGKYDEALAMVEAELEKYPQDIYYRSYRATVLFHMENFAEAQKQIEELAPLLMEESPRFTGGASYYYGPRLVWLLRKSGHDEQAQAIYSAFYESFKDLPETAGAGLLSRPLIMARWEASIGQREAMLEHLEARAEISGGDYELFHDPMLMSYAGDPGFDEIAARFEDIRAHYRDALTVMGVL